MANELIFSLLQTPTTALLFNPAPPLGNSIRSTQFGTAQVSRAQGAFGSVLTAFGYVFVRNIPIGFTTTAVGTPYGIFRQVPQGVGFIATQFGTTSNVRTQFAAGSILPTYGTPTGVQHWDAHSLGPITRYGAVFHAYTFTGQTTGLADTDFGHPVAFRVAPGDIGINTDTYAIYSTEFGTPLVTYLLEGSATGFNQTAFGAHTSFFTGAAAGVASTLLGTHFSKRNQYGSGFRNTTVGTPASRRVVSATAISPKARFGIPYIWRSNTFPVYGINDSGKFGQPRGFSRHNHPVTGFFTSYVGVPSCRERSRVTHIPPGSAFGTPLLKRALTC